MCTEGELGMSCLSSLSAGFEFPLRGMATQNWNWFGSCSELQAGALGSGQGGAVEACCDTAQESTVGHHW